ncbi:hypothetical protein Pyn_35415 [Prunus yedoensis var. nudiflora]|uniref:Uncharacterized protein n=1 Tax=Prunus yedoensis var. nudiflora TaxID=2094558 RepID=A0A314XTI3_PRUYE|nr:hypothetical protein Pyn_35415 [Prunus yedoensis var. nudiflora]
MGAAARLAHMSEAVSKALASGGLGREGSKQHRFNPQKDLTNHIESKSSQQFLQVHNLGCHGQRLHEWQQSLFHFFLQGVHDVFAQRLGAELVASQLALGSPKLTIHIEYATSQKISKNFSEGFAFWEVVEVGFEHVLNTLRVGRDDGAPCTKPVHHDGVGG